eukprot:965883-Rhodomonas_salina.1
MRAAPVAMNEERGLKGASERRAGAKEEGIRVLRGGLGGLRPWRGAGRTRTPAIRDVSTAHRTAHAQHDGGTR